MTNSIKKFILFLLLISSKFIFSQNTITTANTIDTVDLIKILNMKSPIRDIINYTVTNSLSLLEQQVCEKGGGCRGNCNGIRGYCGADDHSVVVCDTWGNIVNKIASYGTDPRQKYYVYFPANINPNSPIVVLIHGGGWITGPNPAVTRGWNSVSTPAGTETTNNIVKNLLTQGYVIVVPLYRLVQYGDNNTDIMANTITIQDQINDIDAAITHMKTNFPSCLNLNVNSVQVLGESAGANLALMFAYTKANTSYIKSVVSVAGPTNMNQFANWVKSPPFPFTCGTDLVVDNPNTTIFTHFPFYSVYDPNAPLANLSITEFVNPLTCGVAGIRFNFLIPAVPPYTASDNTAKRITNSFRLAQSCIRQIITTSTITTEFNNVSPCVALNASRIIPMFIIHGTDDWFVPYSKSTSTMDTKLASIGGLIGSYNSTNKSILGNNTPPLLTSNIPTSTYYATSTSKHIIKTYTNSNHDVSNNAQTQPDILIWFNGHQ